MTEAQKSRLGEHLETEYGTLIGLLGDNFHSAVVRMAVQIERISLILTALRGDSILMSRAHNKIEPEYNSGLMDKESRITSGTTDETIYCQDEDYQSAEMIGNKLLLHMAAAYRMIDGESQELVPEIKPLDQRKVLFEQLPGEYAHKELVAEAKAQGIPQSTILRWNNQWIENGLIRRIKHGLYKKVG